MTTAASKILVIEDEPQIRRCLRASLAGNGYAWSRRCVLA